MFYRHNGKRNREYFKLRVSNFKISDNILRIRLKLFNYEVSILTLNSIERLNNLVYRIR